MEQEIGNNAEMKGSSSANCWALYKIGYKKKKDCHKYEGSQERTLLVMKPLLPMREMGRHRAGDGEKYQLQQKEWERTDSSQGFAGFSQP